MYPLPYGTILSRNVIITRDTRVADRCTTFLSTQRNFLYTLLPMSGEGKIFMSGV